MQTVVAIGKFEGVHRGHQTIISRLTAEARKRVARSVVLTFTHNPLRVLAPEECPKELMSPAQRVETLTGIGVDEVVMLPFTVEFAALSPEEFVRTELVEKLHAVHVIVGDDFRFGAKASGTPDLLTRLGKQYGFTVEVIDEIADEQHGRVSATAIREALAAGDVTLAEQLLGAPHRIRGRVVHGDARGRELGFPTANLGPSPGDTRLEGLVPADGVYAGAAHVAGAHYTAAISVGNNPTFTPEGESKVEAYLLDMNGDIYGETIELEFFELLRPTQSFDGVEPLLAAMHRDVQRTRQIAQARR